MRGGPTIRVINVNTNKYWKFITDTPLHVQVYAVCIMLFVAVFVEEKNKERKKEKSLKPDTGWFWPILKRWNVKNRWLGIALGIADNNYLNW